MFGATSRTTSSCEADASGSSLTTQRTSTSPTSWLAMRLPRKATSSAVPGTPAMDNGFGRLRGSNASAPARTCAGSAGGGGD